MTMIFAFCSMSAPLLRQKQCANRCPYSATFSPWAYNTGLSRPPRCPFVVDVWDEKGSIAATQMQSGGNDGVPIDAPSGLLLAVASVLAIASVGCVFELAGGHPQYGQSVTGGILAVSFPAFIGLFYAAIRKGQAEAEED